MQNKKNPKSYLDYLDEADPKTFAISTWNYDKKSHKLTEKQAGGVYTPCNVKFNNIWKRGRI